MPKKTNLIGVVVESVFALPSVIDGTASLVSASSPALPVSRVTFMSRQNQVFTGAATAPSQNSRSAPAPTATLMASTYRNDAGEKTSSRPTSVRTPWPT